MNDLVIKSIVSAVASSGPSALVQAQVQAPTPPAASVSVQANAEKKAAAPQEPVSPLEKAAATIAQFIPQQPPGTQLRIEKAKGLDVFVYQSVDSKSGKVVSQYPAKQILQFISYFREKEGLAVDQSA